MENTNETSPEFEAWIDLMKIPRASIEYKFQFYMFKVGLWGTPVGEVQMLETRRAFMGGFAAMFLEMGEIGGWEEEQAARLLELRGMEISAYWEREDLKRQRMQN